MRASSSSCRCCAMSSGEMPGTVLTRPLSSAICVTFFTPSGLMLL